MCTQQPVSTPSPEREAAAKLPDGDPSSEVVVFGGIRGNAPICRYVEALADIESLETGSGVRVTKRITSAPDVEDFAAMHLPRGRPG